MMTVGILINKPKEYVSRGKKYSFENWVELLFVLLDFAKTVML